MDKRSIFDIYGKWYVCDIHKMRFRTVRGRTKCCLCLAPSHKHINTSEEYLMSERKSMMIF